ncbi:adenylate/guanylate cyclase domain-containing protein [Fluctibacter corallii]|uniref:adenylate/guanylate cyclase domain-containing protein n=1 Tax=Fluctibacter corallii TaxID=2984329 RepID=UPI00384BE5F4
MSELFSQPLFVFLLVILTGYTVLVIGLIWYIRKLKAPLKNDALKPFVTPPAQPNPIQTEPSKNRFIDKADEATRLNQTFQKFVPKQFVDHFAKHGSSTLELGRADEDDVAILFCDIRGFTSLSERMTPQELMRFLNSYFLRMNDPIHQNGGFIDKFIGDAIMALFDHPQGSNEDKARDAIKAAIDLHAALKMYNQHRQNSNYPPINVGIGVHFGPVIIGTVGSDDRMDTTVIGDSVNIAYRLEGLAPLFNADIVVSAQALDTAKANGHFSYRLLEWVKVKGRENAVEIYEILDHLPAKERDQKLLIADDIKHGLALRKRYALQDALDVFTAAHEKAPNDALVLHHIEQCRIMLTKPTPKTKDGALRM